jgi:ribosomal protein S18 acetylase RimI-like enzyme
VSAPPDVAIRPMLPKDLGAVADLTSQLGYPCSEADVVRRYDLLKDRSDARLIVAERSSGAVVGWIHVQELHLLESDTRAEIWGLVVAESARGSGIGRLLMGAAETWAVARGLSMMGLRSNVLRVEAHAFYERLGYRIAKKQNAFRKELQGLGVRA